MLSMTLASKDLIGRMLLRCGNSRNNFGEKSCIDRLLNGQKAFRLRITSRHVSASILQSNSKLQLLMYQRS
jgi:hypothetical protein